MRTTMTYPRYKDSGIEWLGQIPAHWEVIPLKWRARCSSGNVIQVDDVAPSLEEYSQVRVIGGNGLMGYTSKANVVTPVLAIGRVGALCGNVHRVGPPAWVTDNALILQVDTQTFAYSYLHAMLLSRNLNDLAAKTAQPLITGTQVRDQRLPCPPMSEQTAIADFLDRETAKIDALVEKKEQLIGLLQEKRTALITHAVTKGVDPNVPMKNSGIEWLGQIPAHWAVKRLRYLGEAIIGLTFSPADIADKDDGILVLRASNVSHTRIVLKDNVFVSCAIPERLVTRVGDILICSRSGSRALIGKNAMIDEESAGLTFGVFMTVFRSPSNAYLFHVFNSRLFDYQSSAFLTSTINQLTIANLNSFKVPLPPPREHQAIADFLDRETARIDALIAKIQEATERLKEYRTALISATVTGKIDVRDTVQEQGQPSHP